MTGSQKSSTYPSPPSSRSSHESSESLRALEISEGFPHSSDHYGQRRIGRSYSISGFQFENELLPLTSSEPAQSSTPQISKNVGIIKGIALIAGLQIGSGIFSSPGVVIANTNSVGASMAVWIAGVLLAWTGASSFAELGCAIPLNGGAQAYLNHAFNPLVAYLFAWTAISALKPGGNAIIALVFGEYISRLLYHTSGVSVSAEELPQWSVKLTASTAVLIVTLLGIATPNLSTRTAVVFTTVKVLSLVAITVIGMVTLVRGKRTDSFASPPFEESSTNPSSYALALYSALWAVDGWDQVNYVGGEMRNPSKSIPIAIHSSMAIVMVLFVAVNLSYFVLLDKEIVASSNTVALDFGNALMGRTGAIIFAVMVAVSCFGSLNGSFFTSARLIYVAGRERYLPSMFGRLHTKLGTPVNAWCLQAVMTIFFIVVGGGFRSLINFAIVASWGFYFLTVLGLVVLRFKEPYLERPYKTWIVTPLVFCAVALFLLCMPVLAAPIEAIAALAFILSGIPVYYLTQNTTPDSLISRAASSFRSLIRPNRGTGWVPVATDDDTIEMSHTTRT